MVGPWIDISCYSSIGSGLRIHYSHPSPSSRIKLPSKHMENIQTAVFCAINSHIPCFQRDNATLFKPARESWLGDGCPAKLRNSMQHTSSRMRFGCHEPHPGGKLAERPLPSSLTCIVRRGPCLQRVPCPMSGAVNHPVVPLVG